MKRVAGAAIAIAAVGLLVLVAPADGATPVQAAIVDFAYQQGECGSSSGDGNFTIGVGDTITWVNCGQTAHTVTGSNFGDTNDIPPGAVYSRTFTSPGVFPYYCDNHQSMTGSVTVSGAATTTTQTVPPTTRPAPKPTTTTTTTPPATTSTTDRVDGVFTTEPTTSTTSTTVDSTVTTRALGEGGDSGTSAGLVAMLVLGLGAVGTAAALLIRRMRAGAPFGPS